MEDDWRMDPEARIEMEDGWGLGQEVARIEMEDGWGLGPENVRQYADFGVKENSDVAIRY
jgi:hypothetical protein